MCVGCECLIHVIIIHVSKAHLVDVRDVITGAISYHVAVTQSSVEVSLYVSDGARAHTHLSGPGSTVRLRFTTRVKAS